MSSLRQYLDAREHHYIGLLALATATFSLLTLIGSLSLGTSKAALITIGVWTVSIWICILIIRRRFDRVVLAWLVIFPFCYYFFSFPREQAIFTVDRAFLLLILLMFVIGYRQHQAPPMQTDVRIAGYLWAAYLVVCLISLIGHPVAATLSSYRLMVDGMMMPALLGLYALRFFPAVENLRRLHTCICTLMVGIGIIATIELLGGTNLLPFPGAVETWVQTNNARLIRVDGPFENSSVLCVIGIVGFLFIVYSGRILGTSLSPGRRLLHFAAIAFSLASALMPMNRGLVIALFVCACIDYFAPDPLVSRGTWISIFGTLLVLGIIGKVLYPGVYEDRVASGANFYQRIAQNVQTLEVIRDHPFIGVGFGLYHDAVVKDSKYEIRWSGFEAMNVPHNSLSAVLAEEGGIGLVLYVAAQLWFIRAMYRHRHLNRLGWRTFLFCLLIYTIFGLDVGIAYYSDLNLFYMFILGITLQIQLSSSDPDLATTSYDR